MTTPTMPVRAFHARLRLEHTEMDAALERLIQAFGSGDQEAARIALRDFDKLLVAHLESEEAHLLPRFRATNPVEADQLAAEHRAIRAKVDELAIGSDLHLTNLVAIRDLAELLRAHAVREDQILYRWVDRVFGDEQVVARSTQPISPALKGFS
jgi:hemerythrin-like domain-containing protein